MTLTTTPDNLRYPTGPATVGRIQTWLKNLADDVQLALNSLTSQHAEYAANVDGNASESVVGLGVFTRVAAETTDTGFTTAGTTSGIITVNSPGVYAVSAYILLQTSAGATYPATGRTFFNLIVNGKYIQRSSVVVGEDQGSLSVANVRIKNPGEQILFQAFKYGGPYRLVSTVRITKLGRL